MSLLTPDAGLLFWMCLSFGIAFIILAKYGFPVITKMVEERRAFIQKSLEDADTAKAMLENIKSESDAIILSAREEHLRIIREANQLKSSIIKSANEDAKRLTSKQIEIVRLEIEKEKEAAMRDVRSRIALLSVDIAEKLVRTELKKAPAQMDLINRLLDDSPGMNSQN